jgi:glucosamine-phosphate N-acetyltransferase
LSPSFPSSADDINNNYIEKVRNHIKSLNDKDINRKYLLVIKYEDMIIGTGSILIEEKIIHNIGIVGHIEDIVIDKKYRGLNLAKKLIESLIEIGKNNGCYKIILDASNDVKGFYEKLGFRVNSNNMRYDIL